MTRAPHHLIYNTQRKPMVISEYGRIVHEFIDALLKEDDRDKRNRMAKSIIQMLTILNPELKKQHDFEHKLWDHLYIMSDFKMDVDSPYPPPSKELISMKPDEIPYPEQPIKFRFYGRNLQYMVNKAVEMKDAEDQRLFLTQLGSFMKNSSKAWNNEELTDKMISNHLNALSKGALALDEDALTFKGDPNLQIKMAASLASKKKKKKFFNKKKRKF
jgi:hypothetical protein